MNYRGKGNDNKTHGSETGAKRNLFRNEHPEKISEEESSSSPATDYPAETRRGSFRAATSAHENAQQHPLQHVSDLPVSTQPKRGLFRHYRSKPNQTIPSAEKHGKRTSFVAAAPNQDVSFHQSPKKTRRPNFIRRGINRWFNRLLGAMSDRSLANQEEEYAAHRTTRDYAWNTAGVGIWGMAFPLLTIVVTQLVGVEQAGMFSLAFVTGTLLMYVANYGVRTYQISDIKERHSFSDYQINRWITCALMIIVGVLYAMIRGYEQEMFLISLGVYVYKMVDGLADVYEGRLQQVDKLYLAGISLAFRSIVVLVVFALCLVITRNLPVASIAMAIAALASFVVLTFPLALFETPRSRRWNLQSITVLFSQCFPLFLALFLYTLIDNMPKFVMEGVLSYDNQLYFNALYFPAQAILLTVGFIYKPLLLRMAKVWANPALRKRFDLIIAAMLAFVVVLTAFVAFIMGWIGISLMSFLYGVNFEDYRGLAYIMLAAGGITAAIDFLYQIITVLRRQRSVTKLYLITFGFSLFVPVLLVTFTGLPGSVIGYLIVMCILFVLLIWEYMRIRFEFIRADSAENFPANHTVHRGRPAFTDKERPVSPRGSHAAPPQDFPGK